MAEQEAQEAFQYIDVKCREIIFRHLPEYEKTIGLTAPNHEFRSKLTDAIIACVFTHFLLKHRGRLSDLRGNLAEASKEARSAQNSLRKLSDILGDLPQSLRDELAARWGLFGEIAHRSLERQISWLVKVSVLTDVFSEALKTRDRGGRPKMRAFQVLARGLRDACETAGRSAGVTYNPVSGSYGGEFYKLVEAVLPLASKLAEMPQRPLPAPQPGKFALGKYLSNLAPKVRKKNAQGLKCKKPKCTTRGFSPLSFVSCFADNPDNSPVDSEAHK